MNSLNVGQQVNLKEVLKLLLSAAGMELTDTIAAVGTGGGMGRLRISVFGDPEEGNFTFRIPEHYFTLTAVGV